MVVEIAEYYNIPIGVVAIDLSKAVDKLEALKNKGFKGDDCVYCTDNIPGVCLYNGCLSLEYTDSDDETKTKIICYVDGLPIYSRPDGAEDMGRRLGCSGIHEQLCKDSKVTAGGPCICRVYQTGPDGYSKCIEWSPAGCGDDGNVGYMACLTHEEATTKFTDLKPKKRVSNKDPELYKFIREINKLKPKSPPQPVGGIISPFEIPTTESGGGNGNGNGNGGGEDMDCCTWCALGEEGTPPTGCYDWMCSDCYEDDRPPEGDDDRDRGGDGEMPVDGGDY